MEPVSSVLQPGRHPCLQVRVPSASTAPSANPVEQDEEPAVSGEEGEAHYFAANDLDLAAYSSSPDH